MTVAIVNSAGEQVATLVSDRPVERYKQNYLRWNGRRGEAHRYSLLHTPRGLPILLALNAGALAAAGEYRVQVSVRRQHKTVLSPDFTLARARPATPARPGGE